MRLKFPVSGILIPAFALSLMGAGFPDPPSEPLAAAGAKKATAVLAGGCFWGMQGVFEHVKGVTETTVGYAGGEKRTAEYETVSDGNTGHAESVQIVYDPSVVTYGQLLKIYFSVAHDPTTLNRQHNDQGTQYRSAIFYADENQKNIATQYIGILNGAHVFRNPIVTQLTPLSTEAGAEKTQGQSAVKRFYPAEKYHQHYLDQVQACDVKETVHCGELNQGYIRAFDIPLLKDLEHRYPELYAKEIH